MEHYRQKNFEELLGQTLTKVEVHNGNEDTHRIKFYSSTGQTYILHHEQDCCENVKIDDIIGDIKDLFDTPILEAEEVSGETGSTDSYSSFTWTYYKIGTIKGHVSIKWYGTSNGWYSERVSFAETN